MFVERRRRLPEIIRISRCCPISRCNSRRLRSMPGPEQAAPLIRDQSATSVLQVSSRKCSSASPIGARSVLVLAQEEARLLGHSYIGTEHIFLGLILEENGVAAAALTSFGVTLDGVRSEVAEILGTRGRLGRLAPVHPPGQEGPRAVAPRGAASRPQLHRHRAHTSRHHPGGRGRGGAGARTARGRPRIGAPARRGPHFGRSFRGGDGRCGVGFRPGAVRPTSGGRAENPGAPDVGPT